MDHLVSSATRDNNWHSRTAQLLLRNSSRPLVTTQIADIATFSAQFQNRNVRWETLGIFACSIGRATIDVPFYPPLYTTETQKQNLRSLAAELSACSVEICLSLDCLNDLQLVLQYENFILQSHVHGDHSFKAWRRLGDVIATIFALGYHENIDNKGSAPSYLVELRKTAFARVYSADKNVAVFLGRPPRMSKRFCCFHIPSSTSGNRLRNQHSSYKMDSNHDWDPDAVINYRTETRWSALCASIKEELLELLCAEDRNNWNIIFRELRSRAEAQWLALPAHFRLEGSSKQVDRKPFEQDFLISARLNHLHVLFLLHLVQVDRVVDPDIIVIEIAEQMLATVVEAILLRERLVSSGTSIIWRTVHYGLPAAGILLLAMLKRAGSTDLAKSSQSEILKNLSVFAAELEMGTIVGPSEANHALLRRVSEIIQNFLNRMNSEDQQRASDDTGNASQTFGLGRPWDSHFNAETFDFDMGFWDSLAGHPSFLDFDEST